MGKPAARIGDNHICPMSDGPKPHVGGPIVGPGVPNVIIGGMPAAVMGDMCTCVSPAPDTIVLGSVGVFIGGKPAARMGDMCAHGGVIVLGCPTVLIGEIMPGSVSPISISPIIINAMQKMNSNVVIKAAQIVTLIDGAKNGTPFCEKCEQVMKKK